MLADLTTWLFKSPRRLVVVSLSAIILIFVLGSSLFGNTATSSGTDDTTSVSSTAAVLPASDEYVSAAVDFVKEWAQLESGETKAQWLATLTPLATTEYATALKTVDTASLPDSQPEGDPVVRFLAQESAMIAVPLESGESVLVTVVVGDGTSTPKVSDVQPNTGD